MRRCDMHKSTTNTLHTINFMNNLILRTSLASFSRVSRSTCATIRCDTGASMQARQDAMGWKGSFDRTMSFTNTSARLLRNAVTRIKRQIRQRANIIQSTLYFTVLATISTVSWRARTLPTARRS